MKWRKYGVLYSCEGIHPKLHSHSANPVALHKHDDIYRVFYSGRDINNRSSVGAVDIDIVQRKIINKYTEPLFSHGSNNSFYADGVSIGNIYQADGNHYMLFMGWQNPEDSHWRGEIGRLKIQPDLSLALDNDMPFMPLNQSDPISLSYPWVLENENGSYSMWYGSTSTWDAGNGEMLHVINYASSDDGHKWKRQGLAVPYELGKAQAFSRPTVIKNSNNNYSMWFSYRSGTGEKYRIGFAQSKDGLEWELDLANAGIDVSKQGWDSEMIEYPFVLKHLEHTYMLYNGNGYGKTGFGIAILCNE